MSRGWVLRLGLVPLAVICCGAFAAAQFAMPDAKQMSGIPRPVTDLPNGTVSVRLVRGDLSHNIAGHAVELHRGSKVQTTKTDDSGRAQFSALTAGEPLKAVAVVDGERLESQEFPAPSQGGVRLLLVATDKAKEARAAEDANAAPATGQVALGGETRIVIEPGDENVQLYYLLEITNTARVPVSPSTPFMFDMPTGAVGTRIIEGSSPQASATGTHVRVQGPFKPGPTFVEVACELPVPGGGLQIAQQFPAPLERLLIVVKKVGATRLTSPQITTQRDVTAKGGVYIAAAGGAIAPGQPLVLSLSDMPHHSLVPRWTALSLAIVIVLAGVAGSRRQDDTSARADGRRKLIARRDKLFHDLVRLEADHRAGRGDEGRYAARREALIASLEPIYGALDGDDTGPDPADRAGLAA